MLKLIPSMLSFIRLAAAYFIPINAVGGKWLAALIWIICGYLSDLLDGFLARRLNVSTKTGKIIDIGTDIIMDEAIIIGLILTGQIDWRFAAVMVPVIAIIRTPAFYDPPTLGFKIGALMSPIYSLGMIWLVTSTYALNALGLQSLFYLSVPAILIALVILWLKRERIITDLRRFKTAFFQK